MDLELNQSELLYIGSSILTAGAVISFVTGSSTLSPATKMTIMGLMCGFLLLFGTYTPQKLETLLLYGLAAFTYIVGTLYTVSTFNIGSDGSFLILLISAVVFAGLGQLLTEKRSSLPKNKFMIGAAALVLIGLSITLFDLSGPQPSYSLNLNDQVELTESEPTTVGDLAVQNNFIMPRTVDIPRYEACVYTPERRDAMVNMEDSYSLDMIDGGEVKELELTVRTRTRHDEEPEELGNFTVERAENCPDSSEENRIVVTSAD